MDMVAMGRVEIRPQCRAKAATGGLVDGVQKVALGRIGGIPAVEDGDPPPVGQHEGGDINGIAGGMGAALFGACHVAATVAAHGFDPHQRAAQNRACGAIHSEARPSGKGVGQRAGDRAKIGDVEGLGVPRQAGQSHR
ncbi:hypothetical protein KXW36_000423, partial [Aspergillus fumigatus]